MKKEVALFLEMDKRYWERERKNRRTEAIFITAVFIAMVVVCTILLTASH